MGWGDRYAMPWRRHTPRHTSTYIALQRQRRKEEEIVIGGRRIRLSRVGDKGIRVPGYVFMRRFHDILCMGKYAQKYIIYMSSTYTLIFFRNCWMKNALVTGLFEIALVLLSSERRF